LSYNDAVAQPWYAPAGLNRGGLTSVTDTYIRLLQSDRDTLYQARVNPIANFVNDGVCIWGQKTLQARPSALDRVNVRRLLIAVKKFIASSTRYLVFEQNTASTRARFLSITNPYLEQVKAQQGLFAFRVIMDETNNTPDVIDQNILYGQLFLQPTRTAEFIVLDFNIQPTGASFPA
jgi:phage tail sheath protein FI